MSQASNTQAGEISRLSLMPLITGFMGSRIVQVAARLGIADLLVEGPQTSEALAALTQTHAPSLHRLLRALASLGLVEEVEKGRFALTTLGAQLRSDVDGSLRNFAMMFGSERAWQCWGDLLHCVRTGEPAMRHLFGVDSFEYLAAHPEQAKVFNEAMADVTRVVARAVVAAYDFSQFRTIVDVGGGNGTLMAAILGGAPTLRGIVFDLPSGNVDAPRQLAAAGVAERCQVVAGDFFRAVPPNGDAYILKSIIHDWDDVRSVAILKNCRTAIAAGGKLLLVERVIPERMEASASHTRVAMFDMYMLVMPGGRERMESEHRTLLAAAGFRLGAVLPLAETVGVSLIEGLPL